MQRLIYLILNLTLGVAVVGVIHDSGTSPRPVAGQTTIALARDVPQPLQMAYSGAIGGDDAAYHFQPDEPGYTTTNSAHEFDISVSTDTLSIAFGDENWQLSSDTSATGFSLVDNRLTIHRDGFDEWYINGPMGLQQGFTLYQPTNIAFTVGGSLSTTASAQSLSLGDALTFGGLMAFDANDQTVPVEFELDHQRLVYDYDDTGATYPLIIDPWVQQAIFTAEAPAGYDYFGASVALDGATALVNVPGKDNAYIFVRNGSTWTRQAILSGSGTYDWWSKSSALDGNTALIGAEMGNCGPVPDCGSVYVFVRSGTTWMEPSGHAHPA